MKSTISNSSLPLRLFPGRKASRPAENLRRAHARRYAWIVEAKGPGGTTGQSRGRGIRKIWRCQQGVAAVEFALALPLLLMLVFGLIDFGLAMYAKGLITNASQEGARFGAIYRLNSLSVSDIQTHVQAYLQTAGFPAPVTITVAGAGGPSGSPLSVRVDYAYHLQTLPELVAGLAGDLDLSAETVRHLE
jgi:TadE-like protein